MSAHPTRERILEAAARLFAEHGYDGTSTRKVGAAAGANIGTIAYHFGGKPGLYHATLGRMYERVLALDVLATVDTEAPPEARVRQTIELVWRFLRTQQDAVRLLLRHVVDHGALPEPVNAEWSSKLLRRALELQSALGLPSLAEHRLQLLSLNHLLARYAVASPESLVPFTGAGDPDEALAAHLGDVAVMLLQPGLGPPPLSPGGAPTP